MVERIGNTSKIVREMVQFAEDVGYLNEQYSLLLRLYPNRWVGIYNGKIRVASTQKELCKKFRKNSGKAAMQFMRLTPTIQILHETQE